MKWFVVYITVLILSGCSMAPSKPNFSSDQAAARVYIKDSLEWKMSEARRQNDIASITTLLVDKSTVLFSDSQGYANVRQGLKANLDTPYRIGSITKVFTAIALMQMVDEGKVDLDAPLNRYLPEFNIHTPYGQESITIRRILSHQSGLPSEIDIGFKRYAALDDLIPILNETYISFAPETAFNYSNTGFALLGLVIERISGDGYGDYLEKNIFTPLQLKNASVGNQDPRLAHGYESLDAQNLPEIRDVAAGDIAMSGRDLATFAQVLLNQGQYQDENGQNKQLLSESSFEAMFKVQTDNSALDSDLPIGLAWLLFPPVSNLSGMPSFAWHGGSTYFFHSSLMINFDLGVASIALTNSLEGNDSVVNISGEALALAYELKAGKSFISKTKENSIKALVTSFDEATLHKLEGRYFMPHVGEFRLERSGDGMKAISEFGKLEVLHFSDGSFGVKYNAFGFLPFSQEDLDQLRIEVREFDDHILLKERGGVVFAQKAPKLKRLSGNWRDALGRYQHLNPDEDLALERVILREMDGYLLVEISEDEEQETIYFEILNNNRAVSIGYMRDTKYSLILSSVNGMWELNYLGTKLRKEGKDGG
ncbi:serine hydrolase domain-containing protein [Marinomonas balearica]|uniref:CubicO group peptidase (Beta-lactamase class C family) n=1 Tax=Marinomonas balearica TaxID=491947 RepID=A0A4R6MAR6_9GAMM|nr:serine hydrolase domain-containing protein [Marinomonas balearica]TDO98648.1 CubicO group peptidase (beta-lactamase class C family) [Marinomonas balearica]